MVVYFFFTKKYAMVALIRVWSLNFYSRKNSNNPLSGHNIKFLFNKIGPIPIKTYQNIFYGLQLGYGRLFVFKEISAMVVYLSMVFYLAL